VQSVLRNELDETRGKGACQRRRTHLGIADDENNKDKDEEKGRERERERGREGQG